MNRFPLFFLVAATIFLTPAGVFMCGSLVLADEGRGPDLAVPCETSLWESVAETAVLSYLFTPILAHTAAFVLPLLSVTAVGLRWSPLPMTWNRQPPTPPPKLFV